MYLAPKYFLLSELCDVHFRTTAYGANRLNLVNVSFCLFLEIHNMKNTVSAVSSDEIAEQRDNQETEEESKYVGKNSEGTLFLCLWLCICPFFHPFFVSFLTRL